MFIGWEKDGSPMKIVVARYYACKSGWEDLSKKVLNIIRGLAPRGFIVIKMASDGAIYNVSAMKQLTTLTAKEVFPNLPSNFPQDIPVAFFHPTFPSTIVYIGGKCHIGSRSLLILWRILVLKRKRETLLLEVGK